MLRSADDDDSEVLSRSLSTPPPIPSEGLDAAAAVLASGRLFRYGEDTGAEAHVRELEREFAASVGARYAVAMNSCGGTLFAALRCLDVGAGDSVLFNAFTLAPVPGAIGHAQANPVPVEIGADLLIDLTHLELMAARSGARVLLLSHMRGHIADMHRVRETCERLGLRLVEDCAHTMGGGWDGRPTGTFGDVGCFSTQSFKHINGGEGGLLVTDDEDIAARAILMSGSYAMYAQHGARPELAVFERWRAHVPNCSLRMSNLVGALLRPQLAQLDARKQKWNERYAWLVHALGFLPEIAIPRRDPLEDYVASSIQFTIEALDEPALRRVIAGCSARGVLIKWFGELEPVGFTGRTEHWAYIRDRPALPRTNQALARLCDMRIPLDLTRDECDQIGRIIADEICRALRTPPAT